MATFIFIVLLSVGIALSEHKAINEKDIRDNPEYYECINECKAERELEETQQNKI